MSLQQGNHHAEVFKRRSVFAPCVLCESTRSKNLDLACYKSFEKRGALGTIADLFVPCWTNSRTMRYGSYKARNPLPQYVVNWKTTCLSKKSYSQHKLKLMNKSLEEKIFPAFPVVRQKDAKNNVPVCKYNSLCKIVLYWRKSAPLGDSSKSKFLMPMIQQERGTNIFRRIRLPIVFFGQERRRQEYVRNIPLPHVLLWNFNFI